MRFPRSLLPALLAAAALPGGAAGQSDEKLKVATTIPVLKAIADEVATDRFEIFALAKADQDTHHVSPTPVLMNRVRQASLFVELGLSLEIWAPEVMTGSGNTRIARGTPGHCFAGAGIPVEEIPAVVSRAEGDVHPEGNPHLWLDPLRWRDLAANIAAALVRIAPDQKAVVEERLARFQARVEEAMFGPELVKFAGGRKLARLHREGKLAEFLSSNEAAGRLGGWLKRAEPLRGQKIVEFHRSWIYFAKAFGMEIVGSIEEKPGIEPGPRHLVSLVETMKEKKVRLVVVDNFYHPGAPRKAASDAGAKVVIVANQPTGEPGTDTCFQFVDKVLDLLLEGLK